MKCRVGVPVVALLLLVVAASVAMAGDIVTVPTANQVKAGEVDLAMYYLGLDNDSLVEPIQPLDIGFVRAQTAYIGVTDKLEIDVHRYDVDVVGTETIINATYVLQHETMKRPIVVLGTRDLTREHTDPTGAATGASYFVSAAKTLNPPIGGPPKLPIIRLHLSLGTEDETLLGEGRHEGIFGGVQTILKLASPFVGAIALYDGTDVITGLTVVPQPGWPTLKGGTFGGHWWIGMSYTFNEKK
jgi:hypothetical protein